MPRHSRASFSSHHHHNHHHSSSSSSSSASGLAEPAAAQPSYLQHSHSNSYGLLEPATVSSSAPGQYSPTKNTHPLHARRHHRKSSSLASVGLNVPAWSEVEAGIDLLRDRSLEFGAELGGQICGKVPAVRGGVAFISTLRSNLQLTNSLGPPSPYLYPVSPLPPKPTPSAHPASIIMGPSASSSITSPSSKSNTSVRESNPPGTSSSITASTVEKDSLSGIPPLTYAPATDSSDRTAALRLIADSIAQKRQTAAAALIRSPALLAVLTALLGIAYAYLYREPADLVQLFVTCGGIAMILLTAVRFLVSGYLGLAERVNWEWVGPVDELIAAKFGNEIIGAVLLRIEGAEKERKKGKGTGVVRAWTVRKRERGRGVGRGLLEAVAARGLKEKGCADVRFAAVGAGEGRAGDITEAEGGRVVPRWIEALTGVEAAETRREAGLERVLKDVVKETKREKR